MYVREGDRLVFEHTSPDLDTEQYRRIDAERFARLNPRRRETNAQQADRRMRYEATVRWVAAGKPLPVSGDPFVVTL